MTHNLLNLCQDILSTGVVRCFNDESALFNILPVIEVPGSGYSYNRVNNLFDSEKRELGSDSLDTQEMITEKITNPLQIMTSRVKVDRALLLMSGSDVRAIETEIQAKSMARGLHKDILNECKTVAKSPNGINKTLSGTMPTSDEVADMMDEMKLVEGEGVILVAPKTARALTKEAVKSGYVVSNIEMFGKLMPVFNGQPIITSKDLAEGEVLVLFLSESEGVSLATNGGLRTIDLGNKGTQLVTDMEILYTPVIKNTKSVGYMTKASK